ncbi:MAG: hypothetical protein ACYDAD_06630, partial [Acidimicrobiales bacterium]
LRHRDRLVADELALDRAEASRSRWLAERAPELARYAELGRQAGWRGAVLARAAEVAPGGHLVSALGPRPDDLAGRGMWREAARAVESYRERWEVTDPGRALGGEPDRLDQLAQRRSAARSLESAQLVLAPEPTLHRSLVREPLTLVR